MKRRDFLREMGIVALMTSAGCATTPAPVKRPPNIVFMLADDLGCMDLGCYGSTFHETPNLDRMARTGIRFTQAYAACPVCSPTRASIMTGKYPARVKVTNFLKGVRSPEDSPVLTAPYADALALEEMTTAEILRTAGYATCHVGKWHLGGKGFGPDAQGFDTVFPGEGSDLDQARRLTGEACRFIEEHKDRPFFLNCCQMTVHIPLKTKPEKLAKYEDKLAKNPPAPGAQCNPHYAAMLESMDENVGMILDAVERAGLGKDTIIVFFSDNGGLSVKEGPLTPATTNAPLRNGKGYLHEGGIRTPLLVKWEGRAPLSAICDEPVCSIDFMPTFCAAAGISPEDAGAHNVDGVDVLHLFCNPNTPVRREALYWHYPHFANQGGRPGGAVRHGDWKLIENYERGDLELYNLRDDLSEQTNLVGQEPQRAEKLLRMLRKWRKDVDATMPPVNPKYSAK